MAQILRLAILTSFFSLAALPSFPQKSSNSQSFPLGGIAFLPKGFILGLGAGVTGISGTISYSSTDGLIDFDIYRTHCSGDFKVHDTRSFTFPVNCSDGSIGAVVIAGDTEVSFDRGTIDLPSGIKGEFQFGEALERPIKQ